MLWPSTVGTLQAVLGKPEWNLTRKSIEGQYRSQENVMRQETAINWANTGVAPTWSSKVLMPLIFEIRICVWVWAEKRASLQCRHWSLWNETTWGPAGVAGIFFLAGYKNRHKDPDSEWDSIMGVSNIYIYGVGPAALQVHKMPV